MNGRIGRARTLARIRRKREAEARAAGIDPTDRAAMRAFETQRWNQMMDGMRASGALRPRPSCPDRMTILTSLSHGQRLHVRALVEAQMGRRIIRRGQIVCLYRTIAGTFDLGRDTNGNFALVLSNVTEGVHFEVIPGREPWPEETETHPVPWPSISFR